MTGNTPVDTVPAELERQANRINEQVAKLGTMLNTISNHLGDISTMMKDYDPNLVTQVNNLKNAIQSYKTKSANIYGEMSEVLKTYAQGLRYNLDDLTSKVTAITSSVEAL